MPPLPSESLGRLRPDLFMVAPPILPAKNSNKLLAKANLSIPTDERHILGISLSRTHLAAGASVYAGEIDRVLFIEKGIAGETILTSDGDPLGISIIGCEGAVGLRGVISGAYGYQARALTAVEALQISVRTLALACSRSRELESLLRNYSQTLFSDSIVTMACHYYHDLNRRLPRWLLTAASRLGSNRLLITQEILAEAHGVTPGSISAALDGLERRGLVERTRREIIILSRRKLRSTACRCCSAIGLEKKYIVKTRGL